MLLAKGQRHPKPETSFVTTLQFQQVFLPHRSKLLMNFHFIPRNLTNLGYFFRVNNYMPRREPDKTFQSGALIYMFLIYAKALQDSSSPN